MGLVQPASAAKREKNPYRISRNVQNQCHLSYLPLQGKVSFSKSHSYETKMELENHLLGCFFLTGRRMGDEWKVGGILKPLGAIKIPLGSEKRVPTSNH